MSLDVYLTVDMPMKRETSGIFIRRFGTTKEISRQDWDEMCPGHTPTIVEQILVEEEVYCANITHNLYRMATEAGIYMYLWRPEEIGVVFARQLIEPLKEGLAKLRIYPTKFRQYDDPNKWGTYEDFVPWVEGYLMACERYPDAKVRVSR